MIENPLILNKTTIKSKALNDATIVNLLDKTFSIPNEFTYNVVEIPKDCIARMDLIANQIYGDPSFSDLLCKLNGISNPFELNEGMILVIPSPDNIMDFMKEPSIEESDVVGDVNDKPIVKQKHEKRKANEAVLGDTRCRIDKTRGVVIY